MRLSRTAPALLSAVLLLGACQHQPNTGSTALRAARSSIRKAITEFGAVADSKTLNTAAIQKTIDSVASAGGGVVEIPAGVFVSGSIFLKPGVELYLAEGAVLLGSNNIEDYPKRETRIEGHFEPWRMALVNAQGIEHLRISGKGTLNGNGPTYWQAFWKRRMEDARTTNLDVERPRLMFIDRCNDVRIEGIRLHDSGFWNLHMYKCRDVVVDGLEIKAPTSGNQRGPSTDGIDVDSCQNVTIRNTYISCNDDNIALKGSKGPLADKDTDSPPVENILVENCSFGDGNGIITCGSEATLVRNVSVRNCRVDGRTTVLTLKLRPDTPQHYENITIDGVVLKGGGRILNVAPWMQFFDLKGQPAPSRQVNNITLRNITGEYRTMGMIVGNVANEARTATTDVLRDITLENITLKLADEKFLVSGVENLVVKNVTVNGKPLEVKQQPPGSHPRR